MDTSYTSGLVGPLFHGTRYAAARAIVRSGFRRSRSSNYTGTGICLSESLTVAYEYGMYETGGVVLEVWLGSATRWLDQIGDRQVNGRDWDTFFAQSDLDAVRAFGGNVWVLWNPSAAVSISRLTHRQALRRMCAEFEEDGPQCGYNGVVSDYASLWWRQDQEDQNLTRFPEHREKLASRLTRLVGSICSPHARRSKQTKRRCSGGVKPRRSMDQNPEVGSDPNARY
jgi:hypothetical protein